MYREGGTKQMSILWPFVLVCVIVRGVAMSDEKRLMKHLLENYEKVGIYGRPVYNTSHGVDVQFGIGLIHLLDFDATAQVLTTQLWLRYSWTDLLLRWNADDFGGVTELRVPDRNIWTPDIVLYNAVGNKMSQYSDGLAVVSHNGGVLWIPQFVAKSICSADLLNYPYDKQTCSLKFGSWTYDGLRIDINFYQDIQEVDVSDYVQSQEYELKEHGAEKNTICYPCCAEPYPHLKFYIGFERRAGIYGHILVTPSVLLAILMLTIFWLPPNSMHRISIGLFIFLCFVVLQVTLIPRASSSEEPLISVFIWINMILVFIALVWSVLANNLSRLIGKLPCCSNKVVSQLSCLLCVDRRPQKGPGDEGLPLASEGEKAQLNGSLAARQDDGDQDGGLLLTAVLDRFLFIVYFLIIIICLVVYIPRR